MMASLIDAHLHLQDPAFAGELDSVLQRARQAGVRWLVCNGTCESDWPRVQQLARQHREVIPCFGLHPWFVSQSSVNWLATLEQFLQSLPSGVGEIGLDRWIEPRVEPVQEQAFRAQLELARRLNRPAMIHCLRAWDWLMKLLREEPPLPAGLLIHAFGGPIELIQPLAGLGAWFSFAGNVLEERKARLREALRHVPRERLLLETDAPDMVLPEPLRIHQRLKKDGQPVNEPANLPAVLQGVARVLHESEDSLTQQIQENSLRYFASLLPPRNG